MCSNPIKILNPSKWLSPTHGQQLYLYVPCGHCLECRRQKQNEWRIRTYYECMDTIMHDGYMLFDTLTYSNQYLPRVSDFIDVPRELDFSCFRTSDVSDFVKRLRTGLSRPKYVKVNGKKNLIRPAYDVEENLRFFYCSEYGTSEGRTKRPHYHIFFFVRNNAVPYDVLSRAVSEYWQFGRTDGAPFKSLSYVRQHNVFDTLDLSTKRVVMYVAKYVTKSFDYSSLSFKRLLQLTSYFVPDKGECDMRDGVLSDKKARRWFQWLSRFVGEHHHQSLKFGDYYIRYFGEDNLCKNGFLTFYNDGLPFTYSLFPSLKRKLFYNYTKIDGDVRFYLNDRGIRFAWQQVEKRVLNLRSQIDSYNLVHDDKLSFDPFVFLYRHDRLQNVFLDPKTQIVQSSSVYSLNGYRNYGCVDIGFVNQPVVSREDFGSKKRGFKPLFHYRLCDDISKVDGTNFMRMENFSKYAEYFDDCEKQYAKLLLWRSKQHERSFLTAKKLEHSKKLLKSLNLC